MNEPQINAPELPGPTHAAWAAVFGLSNRLPSGWTIVGGQLAQLHAWELGVIPTRTTHDVDTGLDVRGAPRIAASTTRILREAGFVAETTSTDGPAVRWRLGNAEIDVLVPASLGRTITDVNNDAMLASHGIQQALNRSERVNLTLADGSSGTIYRPNLLGAIIAKCAAFANTSDTRPGRHVEDLVFLLGLLGSDDLIDQTVTARDVQHLTRAVESPAMRDALSIAPSSVHWALTILQSAAREFQHHRELARNEMRQGASTCSVCGRPFNSAQSRGMGPSCPAK